MNAALGAQAYFTHQVLVIHVPVLQDTLRILQSKTHLSLSPGCAQVGNGRCVALVSNGTVSLRQDEGGPKVGNYPTRHFQESLLLNNLSPSCNFTSC